MPDLIYLLGGPGAGKTTVLTELLGETGWSDHERPLAHRSRNGTVWLGRHRETFGGTDTLPMNVAPRAEAWIATQPAAVVIGEGDRLAYARFFDVAASAGYLVALAYLDTSPEVAARRREQRAAAAGTGLQSPTWVRGRDTKARRLAAKFTAQRIDGDVPAADGAAQIRAWMLDLGLAPVG